MCIYCTILLPKNLKFFFACAGLSEKCVYIAPFCPSKKLKFFFACAGLSEKCVYMAIWHPKNNQYFFWSVVRFWTEFFSPCKKKLFFTYVWLSVQFWLVLCPLVQSFVICSFSGGQRTKVLISYLHQGGGYSATLTMTMKILVF